MLRPLLLFLLGLLTAAPSAFATVQASFDRTTVTLGETVKLLIEVDAQINTRPDLQPLEQDFAGSRYSSQYAGSVGQWPALG
ncbi:MAG: hypothetical protein R3F37_00210 [Candidatus Competibacteraceae bacterium]